VYVGLASIFSYNVLNVGQVIVNNWANTVNFCCKVGILRIEIKCKGCRQVLKVRRESRSHHVTPVAFRCVNKKCSIFLFIAVPNDKQDACQHSLIASKDTLLECILHPRSGRLAASHVTVR